MKFVFVKLPQPCGCIFAKKTFDTRPESEREGGVFYDADDKPKIIWVYVSPECKQVEHAVEYP